MRHGFLSYVLLFACAGCAGPTIASRVINNDSAGLVRLDTFTDAEKASELAYDHPVAWAAGDLSMILSRVSVQERKGLLEESPTAQPAFFSDQIRLLTPQLQAAFKMARPSEWIAFYVAPPTGSPEITSGAFFVKRGQLHIIIANHRDQVSTDQRSTELVRLNPLHSLHGRALRLTFDPQRYVVGTQANWRAGSHGTPASELLLDYPAFLQDIRPAVPSLASPPISPAQPSARESPDTLMKLQEEVARLRQQVYQQAEEIAQLKRRLEELAITSPTLPKKQSPR